MARHAGAWYNFGSRRPQAVMTADLRRSAPAGEVILEYMACFLALENLKELGIERYKGGHRYLRPALSNLQALPSQGGEAQVGYSGARHLGDGPFPISPVDDLHHIVAKSEMEVIGAAEWLKGKIVAIDADSGLPIVKRETASTAPKARPTKAARVRG